MFVCEYMYSTYSFLDKEGRMDLVGPLSHLLQVTLSVALSHQVEQLKYVRSCDASVRSHQYKYFYFTLMPTFLCI